MLPQRSIRWYCTSPCIYWTLINLSSTGDNIANVAKSSSEQAIQRTGGATGLFDCNYEPFEAKPHRSIIVR